MRTLTLLLGLLTITATPALGLAPAAALAPDPVLGAALEDQARLQRAASTLLAAEGLAGALVALDGVAAAAVPDLTFEAAMAALYAEAGVALPADYARPDAALAAALAPLLAAATVSAQQTDLAFTALAPDERAWLLENVHLALAPAPGEGADEAAARVHALAAQVDLGALASGAAALALALDRFAPPGGGVQASWVAPGGLVEIGSTGNDVYCAERLLIVDLGGNDRYDCHPASYAPGSSLPLPVSAILDLGGNDVYTTYALHPSSFTSTWGQGVGIGGVGLIVDRWGDDAYVATLADAASWCSWDFYEGSPQNMYAQAVGALGVGAILDASGNDYYTAYNWNTIKVSCHFGWVYTFAQGVGLVGGVGLLVDDTGDDGYYASATALGKFDNIAGTFAQAAAAGGIGALVDKEGSDAYWTDANAYITLGLVKGAFAYVFSQASVTATRRQPAADPAFQILGGSIVRLDGLCPNLPNGGASAQGGTCDAAGAAILVDALGDDRWDARAYADDLNRGCGNGLWSVVSSQGSASWTGVAALLNLDVEGRDNYTVDAFARGTHCGFPAVRSHVYGQGYGGPILWDFWDLPEPQGVEQRPLGVLASLGVPEETCTPTETIEVSTPIADLDDAIGGPVVSTRLCDTLSKLGPPKLTASPDKYRANAVAVNPQNTANAETWTQGSAGRTITIPSYWTGTYPALGIGVHLDVGGEDTYDAQAHATGPKPDAWVRSQASTRDAVALLANVGGADGYNAFATHNAVAQPTRTLVQGYADAGTGITTPGPLCVSTSLVLICVFPVTISAGGLAAFLEVFGYDSYSENPERAGCMPQGTLVGGWPLGLPLGTVWWGTVFGSPCPTPTPGVGNGMVLGLDWWSEAV